MSELNAGERTATDPDDYEILVPFEHCVFSLGISECTCFLGTARRVGCWEEEERDGLSEG
jgi:hypothetical protein